MGFIEIKRILNKFRDEECTPEELKTLWEWFSDVNNENTAKDLFLEDLYNYKVNYSQAENKDYKELYNKIWLNIDDGVDKTHLKNNIFKSKKLSITRLISAAAILILFFGSGVLYSRLFNKSEISKITYSEIKVPLGSKSEVLLPDGSYIWLNAGSKIKYPNQYNKENRNIILEGEAYFKVAKNKHLPFIVQTGDLKIIAVGTEFNVKSYNEEGIIETTLVEGKVTIHRNNLINKQKEQQIFLKPKQKAVYVKNKQELKIEDIKKIENSNPEIINPKKGIVYIETKIDPLPVISWKDNRLVFKSEKMGSLAVKLERKYDVTISFDSENIKQYCFSGILEDETLTQVMDVIKLTAPIDYKLNGKEVRIYENKQMMQKFNFHLKRK